MLNLYMFQPNYKGGMEPFSSHWLPYSVASIWAYVSTFENIKNSINLKDTFFARKSVDTILNSVDNPDICMFSTYIWNENYNLTIAKAIKEQYPNCLIIFGGPQVDDDGQAFLDRNPVVDTIVQQEGEIAAKELLSQYLENRTYKRIYTAKRIGDLSELPSPYLHTDIMEKIIKENDSKWSATIETNRGCPFACSFCDWGGLTHSKIKKLDLERVFAEIDWLAERKVDQLIIADANFGVFYERDKMIAEHIVRAKKRTGYPLSVPIAHYKNSTEKVLEIVKLLADAGMNRGMSLSVQSLNDDTLVEIERKNMEINSLSKLYNDCNRNNISYYTEFIMCLPYETKETWTKGLGKALEAGCHGYLEIYPLEILRNSTLAKQVEKHGFEVYNYDVLEKNQESEIPEKHNFVISSKYMPREDYQEAWMYSWVVVNFHTYGWSQIIARFARKHLNISYYEIYKNLYNYVLNHKGLRELHDLYLEGWSNFFYKDPTALDIFKRADDITPDVIQIELHKRREVVMQAVIEWGYQLLQELPLDLVDEIIKLQDTFVYDFEDKKDNQIHNFKYNIYDYIIDNTKLEKSNMGYDYKFSNSMQWETWDDYHAKIYMKIRDGFGKKRITIIPQQDLAHA